MDTKEVFADNLNHYLRKSGKSRKEVCAALGFSYYTFSDWCLGRKYPRMDKVEKLAQYFGCLISDLTDEKTDADREMQKKNDAITDIVVRMRTDSDFYDLVESLNTLDVEKVRGVKHMLSVFLK